MIRIGEKKIPPDLSSGSHFRRFLKRSRLLDGRFCSKQAIYVCLILVCVFLSFCLVQAAATVEVEVIHSQDRYPAGGTYPILFKLRIPSSWYIHGTQESGKDLIPTELSFEKISGVKIKDIQFPPPIKKKFDYLDEAFDLFSGEILVSATLKISKRATPGDLAVKGLLTYQSCTSKCCMPPENVPVTLYLTIAPEGAPVSPLNSDMFKSEAGPSASLARFGRWGSEAGLWLTLFGIFLGGMALNLTPCIYPLIPITVSYFGGMSKRIQGRTIVHGILYISGLSITNSLLGLTASLTGSMLGYFLQKPVVLMFVAGFLFFMALSFFDLWEFQLPSVLTRLASRNFGGYFGTFFMGLTLGIVAAPCLGPFMLGLLTWVAQMADPLLGFLYFFVLSIGMGLPLAALAVFSGALKKLPLSGGWLMWIRKGLGWVLIGMGGYIMRPLISAPSGKVAMIAIILASAGVHLGWLERSHGTLPFFPLVKKGVGTALICAAVIFFLFPSRSMEGKGIKWIPYDLKLLVEASQKSRPVILDFYADWCAPCRALEKEVFSDPEVVALSQHFLTLRIDLTKNHPNQNELQKRYQILGVPTIVFINREGDVERELRIESFVNRDVVLQRMKRLIEES